MHMHWFIYVVLVFGCITDRSITTFLVLVQIFPAGYALLRHRCVSTFRIAFTWLYDLCWPPYIIDFLIYICMICVYYGAQITHNQSNCCATDLCAEDYFHADHPPFQGHQHNASFSHFITDFKLFFDYFTNEACKI
jgi:hypothetical protein